MIELPAIALATRVSIVKRAKYVSKLFAKDFESADTHVEKERERGIWRTS